MQRFVKIALFAFILVFSKETFALNAPLPSGFKTIETKECSISVPENNESIAKGLLEECVQTKKQIFTQLGLNSDSLKGAVDIRVVNKPSDMKLVSPGGSHPPTWSGAVAYPAFNLLILSLNHHTGKPVEGLETVLEHEMSHLALRIALNGATVPRWFSEGVAIQQSEESSIKRIYLVWTAAFGDSLLPLSSIDRYPDQPGKINLAYAQAADFVGFLIRDRGWEGIRETIRKRAEGTSFVDSIESTYSKPLLHLEHTWRAGLVDRWQWVPLVTGTGAIWGFIVALFLTAYIISRRRKKKRMAEMEVEELEAMPVLGHKKQSLKTNPRLKDKPPKVPTKIRVDDDIHTLH